MTFNAPACRGVFVGVAACSGLGRWADLDAITALLLALVERLVGQAQQVVGGLSGIVGYANAQLDGRAPWRTVFLQIALQALCQAGQAGRVAVAGG